MTIEHNTIFGRLPACLFRLFSGRNPRFFAGLVEYLDTEVFGAAGDVISKRAAIEAVGEFIEREAQDLDLGDDIDAPLSVDEARDKDPRKYIAFYRLQATGWLIEHRDRYRKIVDFDPEARLLLQAMLEIKSGSLRSYGGEVLQILTLLRSVLHGPEIAAGEIDNSENIHNAARAARGFINHLRTVTGSMRRIEEAIQAQTTIREVIHTFFDNFIAENLIADFVHLKTDHNPFRFRNAIIDTAQNIAGDPELLAKLAAATVREGRARDAAAAEATILSELQSIIRLLQSVSEHLDLIDTTQLRIDRRMRNTIRYMDRIEVSRTDRIRHAIEGIGQTPQALDEPLSIAHRLISFDMPRDRSHLFTTARRDAEIMPNAIRKPEPDPILEAYTAAIRDYEVRSLITPEKLIGFVEKSLGDRTEIAASEIAIDSLDDFFVFERLREIPFMFDGTLNERYHVIFPPRRIQNQWIDCPDFVIRRQPQENRLERA